jgi:hypothetical protein
MQDLNTLIWSMSILRVTNDSTNPTAAWPNLPVSATECALYYCVNKNTAVVRDGKLQMVVETVSDAHRVKDSWQPQYNDATTDDGVSMLNNTLKESIAFDAYFSIVPRTDLALLSPAGNLFNLSQAAVDGTSSYIQSTFASKLTEVTSGNLNKSGVYNGYYQDSLDLLYDPPIISALFASEDIDGTFATLAASMTNAITSGADEEFNGKSNIVTGNKGTVVTVYKIVWPWITLHVLVVATGLIFLVATILENGRDGQPTPVWKTSSLATLSRGAVVEDILAGMDTVKELKKRAEVTRVRLFGKPTNPDPVHGL